MAAKQNSNFTHLIAIDFGTYGCGIAVSTDVDSRDLDPSNIYVYSNWSYNKMDVKGQIALLLNDEGKLEAFGDDAIYNYQTKQRFRRPDRGDRYYFFYRYKMCLYNKV